MQGTWVHPKVAIHLAQWLSPKFALQVSEWVFDWFNGKVNKSVPEHFRRFLTNQHKIPDTHFSMLNQMILRLLAPLEKQGYSIPNNMMPDISLGLMFSKWLRDKGYEPDNFSYYIHKFLDHRPDVKARLYPNELLTEFNKQLNLWLTDGRALKYFSQKDLKSVEPFERVVALPKPTIHGLPE